MKLCFICQTSAAPESVQTLVQCSKCREEGYICAMCSKFWYADSQSYFADKWNRRHICQATVSR